MSKFICTSDLANAHGVTVQTINRWRVKAELKAERQFGTRSEQDSRVVVFSEQEVQLIIDQGPKVRPFLSSPEPIEAEIVDAGEVTSLVPLNSATNETALISHFNRRAVDQDIAALQLRAQIAASQANNVLSSFAKTRIKQAASRIEIAVATLEANAMADIGMEANAVVSEE